MTTDQDNQRVSAAYRELPRETTPAALDEQVLAMAERNARSRYGFARAWVRPLAWAATIALSLGFVLEMTWFADAPPEVAAPRPATSAERARQDAEVMKAKQETSRYQGVAEQAAEPPPQHVEDQAQQPAVAARAVAGASLAEARDLQQYCDSEARLSAATWYECIRELRDQGLDEAATFELQQLRHAFPDFREPTPE